MVTFKIFLDSKEFFNSGEFIFAPAAEILLPLGNATELTLIVDSLGNKDHHHADWVAASFIRTGVELPLVENVIAVGEN
ncbi:MAG: hypothetical protein ACI9JM_003348 [Halioglobus sp.]